jgi:cell division protein FtsA
MQPNYIVGLDIGSTKINAVIASKNEDGLISVIGVGSSHKSGLRNGKIINLEETVTGIRQAAKNAELQAGLPIESVYVGISGNFIESSNSRGVIGISGANNEITGDDVKRVIEAARNYARPQERKILHVIPQQFIVDEQEGISKPVGMSGVRLEADVHIVTTHESPMQNIVRAVEKAGIAVNQVVLNQIASSNGVLDPDEKELGVCLIDIGGDSCDIAMFYEGSIRYSAVVPLGGISISRDLAAGLRLPTDRAEELKVRYGDVMSERLRGEDDITIESIGGRGQQVIPRHYLAEIIAPRVEEILNFIAEKIDESQFSELMRAGIVLTGGSSLLPGIQEAAEQILGLPVRIGVPIQISGLTDNVASPAYATGVGLVKYGFEHGHAVVSKSRFLGISENKSFFDKLLKKFEDFF